jgi:hypothetical protein
MSRCIFAFALALTALLPQALDGHLQSAVDLPGVSLVMTIDWHLALAAGAGAFTP